MPTLGWRLLLRGLTAGLISGGLLIAVRATEAGLPLTVLLMGGMVTGLAYPLLFGESDEGAGPAMIRGLGLGFLVWLLGELTIVPLILDGSVQWAMTPVGETIERLPAALLLGAGVGVTFTMLGNAARALFVDDVRKLRRRSPGGRALVALGLGCAAGIAGGLVFTVVLYLVDGLTTISGLVGAQDATVGLVVHLVVAQIIGVAYATLFTEHSFDPASGLGWGLSYGVLWWFLGSRTLLPVLTGSPPLWAAADLATGFPSLIGHLAYGAVLGLVIQRLRDRVNPWWFTRSAVEAEHARRNRDQIEGSAPALWGLTVFIALTIPLLVGA